MALFYAGPSTGTLYGLERWSMSSSPPRLRVVLIGAGNVGVAVCSLLQRRGHEIVGVASRSRSSAEAGAGRLGTRTMVFDSSFPSCDVVLLGVTEDALGEVSARLAPFLAGHEIVCHFAGARGVEALEALGDRARGLCALHPVQAVPSVDAGVDRLPGSAWGVTCSPGVQDWAEEFVSDELGGAPVTVAENDRVSWHAAAVMSSNGIVALLALGESILESIGVDDPHAVLGPLTAGTAANAAEAGRAATALTGPIVRGETSTVERHIDALSKAPELRAAYLNAARLILAAAATSGRAAPDESDAIRAVLERA